MQHATHKFVIVCNMTIDGFPQQKRFSFFSFLHVCLKVCSAQRISKFDLADLFLAALSVINLLTCIILDDMKLVCFI